MIRHTTELCPPTAISSAALSWSNTHSKTALSTYGHCQQSDFDPTKFDPFIQGKNVYYGVTEVLQFKGRNCIAAYVDPLATETVNFAGHTYLGGRRLHRPAGPGTG